MENLLRGTCGAIAAALFSFISATAAISQDTGNRVLMWGAVGLGAATPASGGDGIANMAQLVFQKKPHHFAIRALVVHDIDRPTNEIGEFSLLYGRTSILGPSPIVLAAGLSAVGFFDCPDDDDDSCFTPGVPLIAEVSRSTRMS